MFFPLETVLLSETLIRFRLRSQIFCWFLISILEKSVKIFDITSFHVFNGVTKAKAYQSGSNVTLLSYEAIARNLKLGKTLITRFPLLPK